MPYHSNDELPPQVQENLPNHAQEIYREAHNNALEQYENPDKRRGDDLETVAHKVAWAAVKQDYKKDKEGNWVEK